MIRPLRRYHFVLWRILTVVLPVFFILALWLRPASGENYLSVEKDFSFGIEALSDSTSQISIDVKNALKVPSCVVYASVATRNILLGKLEQKGTYHFEIENKSHGDIQLRLFDPLHNKEIVTVSLTENAK
jgi:hypothetical protein